MLNFELPSETINVWAAPFTGPLKKRKRAPVWSIQSCSWALSLPPTVRSVKIPSIQIVFQFMAECSILCWISCGLLAMLRIGSGGVEVEPGSVRAGGVKVGPGSGRAGGVGVGPKVGVLCRGGRSTCTSRVPQAERARVVIKNNQRIFLIISPSEQRCCQDLLTAWLYQDTVTWLQRPGYIFVTPPI